MTMLCWTQDRNGILVKLVRSHAFDFDATSRSFQEYLRDRDVAFKTEELEPESLRKRFASLHDKQSGRSSTSPTAVSTNASTPCDNARLSARAMEGISSTAGSLTPPSHDGGCVKHAFQEAMAKMDGSCAKTGPYTAIFETSDRKLIIDNRKANDCSPPRETQSSSDSTWTFSAFLAQQKKQLKSHEAKKELTFRRVLAAIGDAASDTNDLPTDILHSWQTRNEEAQAAAREADEKRQRHEEEIELSLQRERLKRRHLPGGEDSVGDDPLGSPDQPYGGTPTEGPPGPTPGRIKLELGINTELLESILSELEDLRSTSGDDSTNSELSQVLDILDEAAGDTP